MHDIINPKSYAQQLSGYEAELVADKKRQQHEELAKYIDVFSVITPFRLFYTCPLSYLQLAIINGREFSVTEKIYYSHTDRRERNCSNDPLVTKRRAACLKYYYKKKLAQSKMRAINRDAACSILQQDNK